MQRVLENAGFSHPPQEFAVLNDGAWLVVFADRYFASDDVQPELKKELVLAPTTGKRTYAPREVGGRSAPRKGTNRAYASTAAN